MSAVGFCENGFVARFGKPKRDELEKLKEFAAKHQGVEGYLEPRTATFDQSLLLVARGGEWQGGPGAGRQRGGGVRTKGGPEKGERRPRGPPPPPTWSPGPIRKFPRIANSLKARKSPKRQTVSPA